MFTTKLLWLAWLAILGFFLADLLFPISNTLTRLAGVALLAILWFGLIALTWRQRFLSMPLLCLTVFCVVFLVLPARRHPDADSLRADYVAGLRHYEGVIYIWGGESLTGIDCSGLIRRGLIDSLFLRGIRTFDAGLVRQSIWVWWHDCTARDFGQGHGFTARLFDTPSINALDPSKILPGDLAVTDNGVHIMAYLGNSVWTEADPDLGRVVAISAPSKDTVWFRGPMTIVRWRMFQP
jgi:hypothetical protein